jgi:hypothetical protein
MHRSVNLGHYPIILEDSFEHIVIIFGLLSALSFLICLVLIVRDYLGVVTDKPIDDTTALIN